MIEAGVQSDQTAEFSWLLDTCPRNKGTFEDHKLVIIHFMGGTSFDVNGYTLEMQTGVLNDSKPVPISFSSEYQVPPLCRK
jgi:hypothetical protein